MRSKKQLKALQKKRKGIIGQLEKFGPSSSKDLAKRLKSNSLVIGQLLRYMLDEGLVTKDTQNPMVPVWVLVKSKAQSKVQKSKPSLKRPALKPRLHTVDTEDENLTPSDREVLGNIFRRLDPNVTHTARSPSTTYSQVLVLQMGNYKISIEPIEEQEAVAV